MSVSIDLLPCHADQLGESPIWDDVSACLYWVDSLAPHICRFDPSSGQRTTWPTPSAVGSIGLTRTPGHLIAALKDGFYDLDLATGAMHRVASPPAHDLASRLNDGKVDRQGRFVCGTLVPHGHTEFGRLFSLDAAGAVTCLETGVHISNSLSFSLDGRTMYFADSLRRAIWAYDYATETGAVSNKRVLIDTGPLKSGTDGACIDADDCLWVALVEIGQVARITPDGRIDHSVAVPAEFPTCPAFGGDGLSTLFVTSIRDSGGRLKGTRPESGRVMALTGLGVSGVPEPRFAGI